MTVFPWKSLDSCNRRAALVGTGAAFSAAAAFAAWDRWGRAPAPVFLARNQRYDGSLVQTIRDGLRHVGFLPEHFANKRVLLKPNLVEPSRDVPHMTTHPAVVVAVAEVLRQWGAAVVVGEAPGHVRDTEMAVVESGLMESLDQAELKFADLNYEDVTWVKNRGKMSRLSGFWFPNTVAQADYVVSLPKLKTHHWVGMTASLKNMYGTLPGIKYGWPKNVLHHAGIHETVIDINRSLPPALAIVDGIVCMEGDGPIMGTAKPLGLIGVGANLAALDATLARVIGLEPSRIRYLRDAGGRIGPIHEQGIAQRGESWRTLATPFHLVDFPHIQNLRRRETAVDLT
jgi:uncharacterized protein (DUF362 family)